MRRSLGSGRKGDGVDEVPAPVALDLNCVYACFEQHLTGRYSCPFRGRGKTDLAAACVVKDNVGELVAIGSVVDQLEVVQTPGLAGDVKRNFIRGVREAFYVSGS